MIQRETFKDREAWLASRNANPVLGSSDVGTIMGLNPYCTPYQYWAKAKAEPAAEPDNDNLYRGQFKEDAIAQMFAHKTGEKIIQRSAEITVYKNDNLPHYVQVAPDRELFAKGREGRIVLECKDTKMYIDELTEETMPKMWFAQIQYQMGVMGRNAAYLAVEDGGKELRYALFDFKSEAFKLITDYCFAWFERYILGDEIPPVETAEDAKVAFPYSTPDTKDVPFSVYEAINELKKLKKAQKDLEVLEQGLEDIIKPAFEEHEAIKFGEQVLATYKTQKSLRIDVKSLKNDLPDIAEKYGKETVSRTLRLK